MSFRREGEHLYVACSYRAGIAAISFAEFAEAVREFVVTRIQWISQNHPRAMANPAMDEVLARMRIEPQSFD
jgi:hypothetical protein